VVLAIGLGGCMTVPSGAGLLPAKRATNSLNGGAWLAKVSIQDPQLTNRDVVEESLTLAVLQYVGDAGYFARVNPLPGKPRAGDYLLRIVVDRYRQERSVHPAYFPAAFFTLTFYIWFGGPIVRDSIDLAGTLTVETADGTRLTEVTDSRRERHNVSIWSPQYVLPSGIQGRTEFFEALLDKAVVQLRGLRQSDDPMRGDEGRNQR
jgi:hypothetical protein